MSVSWWPLLVALLAVAGLVWLLVRTGGHHALLRLFGGDAPGAAASTVQPQRALQPASANTGPGALIVKQLCLGYMQNDMPAVRLAEESLRGLHPRAAEVARHLQLVFESLALIERTKNSGTLESRLQVAVLNAQEACSVAPELLSPEHRDELLGVLKEAATHRMQQLGPARPPRDNAPAGSGPFIRRGGRARPADEAFLAWTSGDLEQMLRATGSSTHPVDRHHLLQCIVVATYARRSDPDMRRLCIEHAQMHLNEFPKLLPALKREWGGSLLHVPVFQHYATVLTEDGLFDEAIAVCRAALSYDLHDNTVSGYEGRIARIQKKAGKR